MKLLLTSGGITNPTIEAALAEMLGKPIAESTALFVPTAQYGQAACPPAGGGGAIAGHGVCGPGWDSLGGLALTPPPRLPPPRPREGHLSEPGARPAQ